MSKALARASPLKPEVRLAQAVSEFEADLSSEQKTAFRVLKSQSLLAPPTPSDVMRLTAEVDRRISKKFSSRCLGPRFTNFLQAVQQFAALGDIMVGGSQNLIACGVWSLVRMSLLSFVSVSNHVETLSSIFMDIGRSCPRHQEIAVIYPLSTRLQAYILEYFVVVVGLCRYLFRFGQKSALQQFTSSLSDGNVKAFQCDLGKWAHSIEKEMQVGEAQESSSFRALSRSMFNSASYQQKLAAKKRVLDFCSMYDHETTWKQIRKVGNTSLYTHFQEYEKWRDCSHPCTLVLTGKLGSGKSVLLANIVDDLSLSNEKDRSLVAYFFCRHDLPESLQARTILGSLARQMLRSVSELGTLSEVCEYTHTTGNVDRLLGMIIRSYPPSHKTFFIIDGLDECPDEEIATLAQAVRDIQAKLKVFVCASFRVEPKRGLHSITRRLLDARIVSLPESNPDIESFIEAELCRCLDQDLLNIGDSTLILDIQDTLLQGSQGMFLWAALQIQSLCSMKTDHAIREALGDLPKDLAQTFSRILHKSGNSDPSLQAKTLEVVLAAHRPLTTSELREALSVDPGHAVWDPSKMLNDVQSALACCGCLLTVDEEESTVRVIHHSVKQYIIHGLDDVRHLGFSFEDAQRMLADIVVTYLGYSFFETRLSKTKLSPMMASSAPTSILQSTMGTTSTTRHLAKKLLGSRKQPRFDLSKTLAELRGSMNSNPEHEFTFYGYAQTYWQHHIWYVSGDNRHIEQLSARLIQHRNAELKELDRNFGMHCRWAAKHGNMKVLELLFQKSTGDMKTQYSIPTPLMWAIEYRDKDTVDALVKVGVDVNHGAATGALPTPLIQAVRKGDKEIAKILLSSDKLRVNVQDKNGCTALMMALTEGNIGIVELLLSDERTEVNGEPTGEWTPLMAAVLAGSTSIVKLLVGVDKVDVNMTTKHGQSALMFAGVRGDEDIVEVLLTSNRIDFSATTKFGDTAMMLASKKGHKDVVELLRSRWIHTDSVVPLVRVRSF